jgi:hypothetical protein
LADRSYRSWHITERGCCKYRPRGQAKTLDTRWQVPHEPFIRPAYHEDLAGRLYGLVIRFSGRLPADQAQWLHHVIDVGEYDLALEDLAAMIPYGKVAATGQERGDMDSLARQMGTDLGSSWEKYRPECQDDHGSSASGSLA